MVKKYVFLLLFVCLQNGTIFSGGSLSSGKQESVSKPVNVEKKHLFSRGSGYWTDPADESTTGWFSQLTSPASQRENWYKVSPYVAEFWCAISNVGFLYVGYKHRSPELMAAGLASLLSHSIPKQWLLSVDKAGVLFVLSKVLREYKVFKDNPKLLAPVGLAGLINLTDAYLARNKGYTLPHVVWHLSAALLADVVLTAAKR
ncbi:hypothetical protein H0X48_03035 [Candidatus Dependentiae bacterium]|nr:hypothetical protein [Candidatus Dependentiae bacterium]